MRVLQDRIARKLTGGLDGPSPTGFILSISEAGNAMLIVHDLALLVGPTVLIEVANQYVRLAQNDRVVLQTQNTSRDLASTLGRATSIKVLETKDGKPLHLHEARLAASP